MIMQTTNAPTIRSMNTGGEELDKSSFKGMLIRTQTDSQACIST